MIYGTLTPAYGRDYKTGPDALADWNKGKDFIINNPTMSTYCSILDTEDYPVGHSLQIRWNKLIEVGIIKKQEDGTYIGIFDEDSEECT
jgi:hypothetical protein